MAQKPETKFRAKVDKRLHEVPYSWFESIQQKAIHGTPDKLGCVNGYFVALELKATDEEDLTPLQALKMNRVVAAGGMGVKVTPSNLDWVIELLKELAARRQNANSDMETIPRPKL